MPPSTIGCSMPSSSQIRVRNMARSPLLSGLRRERLDDEPARHVGIDAVTGHARRGVLQDPVGIAPAHVFLVGVLELDAEGAREERQVVLEDDGTLGLEATELAMA